jgi:predicted DNA-binding transcriptional regulator YafY
MATNQQSLRQWHMLRMVPRAPAKISAREMCEQLSAAEFPVTKRTVERDLKELATVFPIVVDSRDKPYGWSWLREATSFDLPALTLPEALTLAWSNSTCGISYRRVHSKHWRRIFRSAARTLSTMDSSSPSRSWLDKVRIVAPQQPLLPPKVNEECQRSVYLALMQDQQIKLHYRKRDASVATVYDVCIR